MAKKLPRLPASHRPAGIDTPRHATAALLQRGAVLHAGGRLRDAEHLYRRVLKMQPDNFDANHMLGVIAVQLGRLEEGVGRIMRATELNPGHAQAQANLGNALFCVRRVAEALRHYDRALELEPRFAGVLNNKGNALQILNRHAEAAECFGRLVELAPTFDFALGNRFHSRRHCCDWRDFELQVRQTLTALGAGRRVDRPFSSLSVSDSAAHQLLCARIYAAYLCPTAGPPLWKGEPYGHERLRVAYVSADFRAHVVSHMMVSMYERHDSRRFDTIGVSLTIDDDSEVLARARRSLGRFLNVSAMSDQQAAALLRELEVDIAVDLTGFTQGCRPGIFARRPAPVQVNFLGFPATMGVPYMDYIIGDDFVIPESLQGSYSEQVVRLPDCFQPSDERRAALSEVPTPSRRDAGLPESGLVLCCFNNAYKLNPRFFAIWMRLLQRAPHTVLWLVGDNAPVQQHLRREAAARGIDTQRLCFAPRIPYAEHLARLTLADLFLDSLPFNAGATASDALWAGVPLITCAGEAFAARMAGSLLRTVGLPELVTSSAEQYEQCATDLVCHPDRLAQLRSQLAANLRSRPLFDSARYCRHLEAAYLQMCARVARGEPPASFSVAAVS